MVLINKMIKKLQICANIAQINVFL